MQTDKILVVISGVLGMAFTYWFFLAKKDKVMEADKEVDIKVEGGYSPAAISVPAGKPTRINFLRTDTNSCLEEIVIADFKIRKFLPLSEKVSVTITPSKTGTFDMTCGMNMFHGKIVVK